MSGYAEVVDRAVYELKTGPLPAMRSMTTLTPADLRAGADRCEMDARFRRALADTMESEGRESISATEANALSREQS